MSTTDKEIQLQGLQQQRNFRASMSAWRKCANYMEGLLSDSRDVSALKRGRKDLEDAMDHLLGTHCELEDLLPRDCQDRVSKYEAVEEENHQLIKKTCERIIELEIDHSEVSSKASSKSRRSQRSLSSRSSSTINRAAVVTEAAAIRAKLKFADIEASKRAELELKRAELEKLHAIKELHVAEATLDALDKAQHYDNLELEESTKIISEEEKHAYVDQYLDSCTAVELNAPGADSAQPNSTPRAELQTYSASAPTENITKAGNVLTIKGDQSMSTVTTSLNPLANRFSPRYSSPTTRMTTADIQPTMVQPSAISYTCRPHPDVDEKTPPAAGSSPDGETRVSNPQEQMMIFAECLAKQFNVNRLPTPEPGVFAGDPLKYPNWKCAFETLIEQRGIPPAERLHYLKKYIGGSAKQAIEGYFFLSTDDAFIQAKRLLEKRYGDPFVIGNAFRSKLESWPKIPPRDGKALRNLGDFMRQCRAAMENIGHLGVLNDEREHRKILAKLPDWLINRWARKVAEYKRKDGTYPSFDEFSRFVEEEADISCDPITSLQGVKGSETNDSNNRNSRTMHRPHGGSSFATGTNTSSDKDDDTKKFTPNRKECVLCGKDHHVATCPTFLSMTMEDRKEYVKKGLCFGCLRPGHISKHCRRRLTCKTCSKNHPTPLHGDIKEANKPTVNMTSAEPQPETATVGPATNVSFLSGLDESGKSTMIVPVWVSHCDDPTVERLVYALLDTQSDTTSFLRAYVVPSG